MVKELILHLGDCKTGSTALQVALSRKGVKIAGHSLYYPPSLNQNTLAQTVNLDGLMTLRGKRLETAQNAFAAIAARMAQSSADFGIISAEHFEFADPATLATLLQTHFPDHMETLRLIVYIRPHSERLLSSFAELTKLGGWQGSIEDFLTGPRFVGSLNYMDRLTKWQDVFGARLIVRPFMRAQLQQGDIVADMAHIIGRGAAFEISPQQAQNPSLSLEDLVLLRRVFHRIRPQGSAQLNACEVLGRQLGRQLAPVAAEKSTKLQLHRALARQVAETYAQDAADLDAAFFAGNLMQTALRNAVKAALDRPQDLRPQTYFDADQLRMIDAWAHMMERVILADPKHAAWAFNAPGQRRRNPPVTPPAQHPIAKADTTWGRILRQLYHSVRK